MKELKERNKIIYDKKIGGMSWNQLAREYGISHQAIQRIVKRIKNKMLDNPN